MYGLNVATRTEVEQRNVILAIMQKFVGEQMQEGRLRGVKKWIQLQRWRQQDRPDLYCFPPLTVRRTQFRIAQWIFCIFALVSLNVN